MAAALRRIGVDPEPPSVDGLKALHRGWVERVPYESVWIHMGERWNIEPLDSLYRVARLGRGGYCYQLNGALSIVLGELGYRVSRHVGGVHGPGGPDPGWMTNHLVLVVEQLPTEDNPEGRWYVDAGLGDGLHEPLPLLAGTYHQGPMTFVLDRTGDGVGDWHFTHDPTGSFSGMSFRDEPVEMAVFDQRHQFLSTSPESSFAGVVTAQLRRADGTDILRGCVLTHRTGDESATETFDRRNDWFGALGDAFAIKPVAPAAALEALWKRVAQAHERWLISDSGPFRVDS